MREGSKNTYPLELEVLDHRIVEAREAQRPAEQARLSLRFNRRRDDVRDLAIQREAIGFRNNEALGTLYPIPPAKK